MKRTPIVTSLLFVGLLLTFSACKKGADAVTPGTSETKGVNGVTIENGRMAFNSHKEYYQFIETVKPGTSDNAGFHSLYTALNAGYKKKDSDAGLSGTLADLDKFDFPEGFLATLNEKGEVKIGDEIIWYHNGNKYFIPASEEANIDQVKQSPDHIKKFFPFVTSLPTMPKNARYPLGLTALDAKNQWPITPKGPNGNDLVGSRRKFVHEVYGKFDPYSDPTIPGVPLHKAYLILRLKMEWEGAHGWNPNANEGRSENLSVSGFCKLPNISRLSRYDQGPNFNVSDSRSSTTSNLEYTLVIVDVVGAFTGSSDWDLEINGNITSYFLGATIDSGQWVDGGALW